MTVMSLIIMMPALVWGAIMSDRVGQARCLIIGYMGCMILAFPLLYSAKYGSFLQQLICQMLFAMTLGFCMGPRSSLAVQIFPISIRYSAVGLSYNVGNALFGGTAPLICALMIEMTGTILAPSIYIVGASLISIICVSLLNRDLSLMKQGKPIDFQKQIYFQNMPGYKKKKRFIH
jgi:MHS family proline/betaine transporter-like MFS transporter